MRLKDKVAIVTGAGRGIGQAIARAFAREGAHVVVNDIDPATAGATAAEAVKLGSKSLAVAGDIARRDDITRIVETTIRERGRVDVVVNNAMRMPGKLEALTEDAWDTTMNIWLRGAFLLSHAAARDMIACKVRQYRAPSTWTSGVIANSETLTHIVSTEKICVRFVTLRRRAWHRVVTPPK